ncbi:TPA: hypothetical protein QDZ66_004511 [Pluralibacter gergoviae]|uniref:putative T6SS immunity periplasmic lipoprotein n=1 Tax=Pluralibacter gergoviae TaxID=61647 RepID=UPI0009BB63A0|nr:putative T6SS immunity periplasmic lipoprotein [Pluralibacter gergoviae]MBL3695611.1 hypothetical protein [Pluralibacter gergoviae]HDS1153683.1 hypothetical protein [Pluralibacter gergoviae]
MVRSVIFRRLWPAFLSVVCLVALAGCPGAGDRMRLDETTSASRKGDSICLSIADAQDYQPVDIGINLRRTPSKKKKFDFSPDLKIVEGSLCIPFSYYHFVTGNKYIIEFVLHSARKSSEPRKFVVGIEINDNQVYNFPLSDREIARPYGSIEVPEE